MITKIFCIGFHKTGTKSMATALTVLGYRVTGPNGVNDPDIEKNVYKMAYSLVDQYDAFQDNPWPIIYKHLDVKYPGSKFILMLRDSDTWIQSLLKHFGSIETPMRRWIYGAGSPKGNEASYVRRFEDHNKDVIEYFKYRPEDLLVMNLAKEDGWKQLCSFLGKPHPSMPFPHVNKASDREQTKN